jgi:hypothetical protein
MSSSSSSSSSSPSIFTQPSFGTLGFTIPADQFEAYQRFLATSQPGGRAHEDEDGAAAADPEVMSGRPLPIAPTPLGATPHSGFLSPMTEASRKPGVKKRSKFFMDEVLAVDPTFKDCLTDFYLPQEEVRKAEAVAPGLPGKMNMGARLMVGPEDLREALNLISISLRYSFHLWDEAEGEAAKAAQTAVMLQMAAATKLQENIMSVSMKIHPQAVRAYVVKDQVPRTIAPFLPQWFRSGAGGDPVLSGSTTPTPELVPADGGTLAVGGAPTSRVPPGCTIIVAPPGAVTAAQAEPQPHQEPQSQQQHMQLQLQPQPQPQPAAQTSAPQPTFSPPFPFTPFGDCPPSPGFPTPASPRMVPFSAPLGYPYPPPYAYGGPPPPWAGASDPFIGPAGFPPYPYGPPPYAIPPPGTLVWSPLSGTRRTWSPTTRERARQGEEIGPRQGLGGGGAADGDRRRGTS